MASLRRYLRLCVATWLAFQVASLLALVPRDCCAAHRPAARGATPSCHEQAAATHCAMRGTCDGPMTALVALLSNYGVLADSFQLLPDLHAGSAGARTREHLITGFAPPDAPPPRA